MKLNKPYICIKFYIKFDQNIHFKIRLSHMNFSLADMLPENPPKSENSRGITMIASSRNFTVVTTRFIVSVSEVSVKFWATGFRGFTESGATQLMQDPLRSTNKSSMSLLF